MNKQSIEELKAFESNPSNNFLTRGQMMEAVRELIAIRDAQDVPVAWIHQGGPFGGAVTRSLSVANTWKNRGDYVTELFTAPQKPVVCQWSADEDFVYSTSCDNEWQFTEGGIEENEIIFCPYCAGKISAAPKSE